jgi:hypothetical protein
VYDFCTFGVFHKIGIKTKLASYGVTFGNLVKVYQVKPSKAANFTKFRNLDNVAVSHFGIYSVSSFVTSKLPGVQKVPAQKLNSLFSIRLYIYRYYQYTIL